MAENEVEIDEELELTKNECRCLPKRLKSAMLTGMKKAAIRARNVDPKDPSNWPEVKYIVSHALLLAYLSMAVKGMGVVVVLWTSVVLLGGFVSMLQKKDFWSLTVITLVQTTGVFDVLQNERLRNIWYSNIAFITTTFTIFEPENKEISSALKTVLVLTAASLVQMLVFTIILCPLIVVYKFGLYISAGISLWRLVERDYGDTVDASRANLTPALDVLYSLALLQAALLGYKVISSYAGNGLVKKVAKSYEFDDKDYNLVKGYLEDTKIKCEKDPSPAVGSRNLIAYAVDLIISEESRNGYLAGLKILDTLIRIDERSVVYGQQVIIEHLLGPSSSSNQILQKLFQPLVDDEYYGSEAKLYSARIFQDIALGIDQEQLPRAIDHITSLLDSFHPSDFDQREKNSDQPDDSYKELVVQGLSILQWLVINEDNCRVLSDSPGLISMIMAPVTSDLLHHINHGEWYGSSVLGSLRVMNRLVDFPGEAGMKLRRQISSSKEAIGTMEKILECDKCDEELQTHAMEILTRLSIGDTSSIMDTVSREKFIKMVLDQFTDDNKDNRMRKLLDNTLWILCFNKESSARIIFKVNDNIVDTLTAMLLDAEKMSGDRTWAAAILVHLCIHYNTDDECLNKLREAMVNAIPKVLGEILSYILTMEETQTGTDADQAGFPLGAIDIENQCEVSKANVQGNSSSRQQRNYGPDVGASSLILCFLNLCVTVCDKLIDVDQDLSHLFQEIAPGNSEFISLPRELRGIVEKWSNQPSVDRLMLLRFTSKMAISLMKHRGSYNIDDMETLVKSVSDASKQVSDLDASLVFMSWNKKDRQRMAFLDHDTSNSFRTLASIVKEAHDLVDKKRVQELEIIPC